MAPTGIQLGIATPGVTCTHPETPGTAAALWGAMGCVAAPQNSYVQALITNHPENVTIGGDRVFTLVVKVKRGQMGAPWSSLASEEEETGLPQTTPGI